MRGEVYVGMSQNKFANEGFSFGTDCFFLYFRFWKGLKHKGSFKLFQQ